MSGTKKQSHKNEFFNIFLWDCHVTSFLAITMNMLLLSSFWPLSMTLNSYEIATHRWK